MDVLYDEGGDGYLQLEMVVELRGANLDNRLLRRGSSPDDFS